jgi:hypothetical protein
MSRRFVDLDAARAIEITPGISDTPLGVSQSPLHVGGIYFLPELPIGFGVDALFEKFQIRPSNSADTDPGLSLFGFRAAGTVAGRWAPSGRLLSGFSAEGHVGYVFTQAPIPTETLEVKSLSHHGPLLAAVMLYDGAGLIGGKLQAQVQPLSFGAEGPNSPDDFKASPQLQLSADVSVGRFNTGGFRWSPLIQYEFVSGQMSGTSYVYNATQHRFGIGLRAFLPNPQTYTVELPPATGPGSLLGLLVMENGDPLPAVTVSVAGQKPVLTDAKGAFELSEVGPGPVQVKVEARGFRTLSQTLNIEPEARTEVSLTLIRPSGPGAIRGTAFLFEGEEKKSPAANVTVEGGGVSVTTGADGTFLLPGVGPGPVQLVLKGEGFKPNEEVVSVPAEAEAAVELKMFKAGTGTLASIRGRVRAVSGAPVPATIRIPEAKFQAKATKDGTFKVQLPGGRYTVAIEAKGFVSQSRVIDVADGDQAIFHVDLHPSAQ